MKALTAKSRSALLILLAIISLTLISSVSAQLPWQHQSHKIVQIRDRVTTEAKTNRLRRGEISTPAIALLTAASSSLPSASLWLAPTHPWTGLVRARAPPA